MSLAIGTNAVVVGAVIDFAMADSPNTILYLVGFVAAAALLEVVVRFYLKREIAARSDGRDMDVKKASRVG